MGKIKNGSEKMKLDRGSKFKVSYVTGTHRQFMNVIVVRIPVLKKIRLREEEVFRDRAVLLISLMVKGGKGSDGSRLLSPKKGESHRVVWTIPRMYSYRSRWRTV